MPSEFFQTSTTWVVYCRSEGRSRRWFKAFGPGTGRQLTAINEQVD
jgi:hypothetical protein